MHREEQKLFQDIMRPVKFELESFESELQSQFSSNLQFLQPLLEYIKSSKGKRIRPIMFFLTQGMVGKPDMKTISIPIFLEMLHTATLIHDDVIDEASKRRERKTINDIWNNKTAILFGDYLFAKVLELGVLTHKFRIIEVITDTVKKISEGELRQIFKSKEIKEDIYYTIIRDKTAALFRATCLLAGLSVSSEKEDISLLERFGELFGMVYQIQDDILDISGRTELLGKSLGQDLSDGKYTLPYIMVYSKATKGEKEYLQDLMNESSRENLKKVYDFIRENKGVELSKIELEKMNHNAAEILKGYKASKYRTALENLLEYNIMRKR